MNEDTLVNLCKQENADAQHRLFQKYAPKMMAVCMRYMGSKPEAQDALQLGFIKVFEQIKKFKGTGSFEGWVRRIMVYTCMDELKKNRRRPDNELITGNESVFDKSAETITAKINADQLLEMVTQLPKGYRSVFNLYVVEGYSHKEISKILGVTQSTSRSQLRKAKSCLREMIEATELKVKTL